MPLTEPYDATMPYTCMKNTQKAQKLLSMTQYRTKEETTKDMLESFVVRGWL